MWRSLFRLSFCTFRFVTFFFFLHFFVVVVVELFLPLRPQAKHGNIIRIRDTTIRISTRPRPDNNKIMYTCCNKRKKGLTEKRIFFFIFFIQATQAWKNALESLELKTKFRQFLLRYRMRNWQARPPKSVRQMTTFDFLTISLIYQGKLMAKESLKMCF